LNREPIEWLGLTVDAFLAHTGPERQNASPYTPGDRGGVPGRARSAAQRVYKGVASLGIEMTISVPDCMNMQTAPISAMPAHAAEGLERYRSFQRPLNESAAASVVGPGRLRTLTCSATTSTMPSFNGRMK
jgi:hypothetical protein